MSQMVKNIEARLDRLKRAIPGPGVGIMCQTETAGRPTVAQSGGIFTARDRPTLSWGHVRPLLWLTFERVGE